MKKIPSLFTLLLPAVLLLNAACGTLDSSLRNSSPATLAGAPVPASGTPAFGSEYRLRYGDRLGVIYLTDFKKDLSEEYRLDIGDEIRMAVYDRDDLSGTFMVVPDGWIYLPLLQPIKVKGMTIKQLTAVVTANYVATVNLPQVTLGIIRTNARANAFVSSIAQLNTQSLLYETTIESDGSAVFPQVGFIPLLGKTLRETNEALAEQYQEILPGVNVTARLVSTRGNIMTILGEVKRPGSFELNGTLSLAAALGTAEGWTTNASIGSIILVQNRQGRMYVEKINLERNLLAATAIQVAPGDLIYVPRTEIADVNQFIDEYIRRNIPFNLGLGFTVPLGD